MGFLSFRLEMGNAKEVSEAKPRVYVILKNGRGQMWSHRETDENWPFMRYELGACVLDPCISQAWAERSQLLVVRSRGVARPSAGGSVVLQGADGVKEHFESWGKNTDLLSSFQIQFYWKPPPSDVCTLKYLTFNFVFCWKKNFFLPHHMARGIFIPWPGIEPSPPAVETLSLNHWTAWEGPWLLTLSQKYQQQTGKDSVASFQ